MVIDFNVLRSIRKRNQMKNLSSILYKVKTRFTGPSFSSTHWWDIYYFFEDLMFQVMRMILQFMELVKKEPVMCVLESSESQCFGFEWFNVNFMKAISGKRHLTMSSKNNHSNCWWLDHWVQQNLSSRNKNRPCIKIWWQC